MHFLRFSHGIRFRRPFSFQTESWSTKRYAHCFIYAPIYFFNWKISGPNVLIPWEIRFLSKYSTVIPLDVWKQHQLNITTPPAHFERVNSSGEELVWQEGHSSWPSISGRTPDCFMVFTEKDKYLEVVLCRLVWREETSYIYFHLSWKFEPFSAVEQNPPLSTWEVNWGSTEYLSHEAWNSLNTSPGNIWLGKENNS